MDVPATEFARNFGRYRDEAQHEPVAVHSHGRTTGYFVSAREYQNYQRLKQREGEALAVEALDEATVEALRRAVVDPRHDHLNALLDD
jgi:PHD/YefM family antitoxin component YafN of YafNO toxin-antitoxin module